MMTTIIVTAIVLLLVCHWLKAKVASKKDPERRSGLESLLVSLMVMHRKGVEDAAETLRTAEISREEGLQKCKDAITDLNESFKKELTAIRLNKSNLEEKVLPDLRKKPGYYTGKASEAKKKYEKYLADSEAPGAKNPEKIKEMAAKYKAQGCRYLAFRQKATDRIEKAEDFLQNIDFTIEETKMSYESHKMELDDLKSELEMMIGNISTAKFQESIALIKGIKDETAGKLRAQNAKIEAEQWISSQTEETTISTGGFEGDFDNL